MKIHKKAQAAFLAVALIYIHSCNTKKNTLNISTIDFNRIIQLDVDSSYSNEKFSTFFDSIRYVQLGKTPIPIIKENRVCIFGNKIFVLDSDIAKGLFVFDLSGKFLYSINIGNYSVPIRDFALGKHDVMYVYVAKEKKILSYAISTGNKIREIEIPGFFHRLIYDRGSFVLLRDGITHFENDPEEYEQARVCIFDSLGNLKKKYLPYPVFKYINFGMINIQSSGSSSYSLARPYNDTVLNIQDLNIRGKYKLNFNEKRDSNIYLARRESDARYLIKQKTQSFLWGDFYETKNLILFSYTSKNRVLLYWSDLNSKKSWHIGLFENDIDKIPNIGDIKQVDDNKIVSAVPAIGLLRVFNHYATSVNSKNLLGENQKLQDLCKNLTQTSNAIISISYFKQPNSNK